MYNVPILLFMHKPLSCNVLILVIVLIIAIFSYTMITISHAGILVHAILFNCGNNDKK